jgi:hypothetical protein
MRLSTSSPSIDQTCESIWKLFTEGNQKMKDRRFTNCEAIA